MAVQTDVEIGFEYDGKLEELAGALRARAITTEPIDESCSRSLRLDDPEKVRQIQINERQRDLHGFAEVGKAGRNATTENA